MTEPDFHALFDLVGPAHVLIRQNAWGRWHLDVSAPIEDDCTGVHVHTEAWRLNTAIDRAVTIILQSTGAWDEVREEWRGVAR